MSILTRSAVRRACRLVTIMGCALGLFQILGAERVTAQSDGPELNELRQHALALVNESRRKSGLSELLPGDDLDEAAMSHAEDMLERDFYAHTSPEGSSVRDRFLDVGGSRWQQVAENIARCQACRPPRSLEGVEDLHQGWMNSPPHRENILSRGLQRFGFGLVIDSDDGLYAVQTFAGPGLPRNAQPGETEEIEPDDQAREALRFVNQARSREERQSLVLSDALIDVANDLLEPLVQGNSASARQVGDTNLFERLPAEAQGDWRRIASLSAECGGCGIKPTMADIRAFRDQWMEDPGSFDVLMAFEHTHVGFAMNANDEGGKLAILVLGTGR